MTMSNLPSLVADLNPSGDYTSTPLSIAIGENDISSAVELLNSGALIDWPISTRKYDEHFRQTALMSAVSKGFIECVRMLLDRGACIDRAGGAALRTPIAMAVTRGDVAMFDLLVSRGAYLRGRTSSKDNLLHLLFSSRIGINAFAGKFDDHAKKMDLLHRMMQLDCFGEMVNESNARGCTPLWLAVDAELREWTTFAAGDAAVLLLNAGARIDLVPLSAQKTQTSLFSLALSRSHEPLVELLLARSDVAHDVVDSQRALGESVKCSNSVAVRWLLQRDGVDVNAVDADGQLPLGRAAAARSAAVVKLLLDAGASINATDTNGRCALAFALDGSSSDIFSLEAGERQLATVDTLLSAGADVNVYATHQRLMLITTFMFTTFKSVTHDRVVRRLLDAGATLEPEAFFAAARSGVAMFEMLLNSADDETIRRAARADSALAHGYCRQTLLFSCGVLGEAIVKRLLDAGCNVHFVDDEGNTALHEAASSDQSAAGDVVRVLLAAGANPTRSNQYGQTPLHWACSGEIVDLLVAAGADVNAAGGEDRSTPLGCVLSNARRIISADAIERLVAFGADPNAPCNYRQLPPLSATAYDVNFDATIADAVRVLLKAGANPNFCADASLVDHNSDIGVTALHRAARESCCLTARVLVEHGADLELPIGPDQLTVLHYVCAINCNVSTQVPIVLMLVALGADVDARTASGSTPLMLCHYAKGRAALLAGGAVHQGKEPLPEILEPFFSTRTQREIDNEFNSMLVDYERMIYSIRTAVVRQRVSEICAAFQSANLPALVLMYIVYNAVPLSIGLRFGKVWEIVTKTKHFVKAAATQID